MSRRAEIKLTADEQRELLESERVVVVSTLGPRGWPHSMPLWYVPRDGEIWIWTYAKSQKVRNLERDPRATLLVETGHEYGELRGVEIEAEAEIHRDLDTVFEFAQELTRPLLGGHRLGRGRRRRGAQGPGAEAGRDPVRAASASPPGTTASSAAPTDASRSRQRRPRAFGTPLCSLAARWRTSRA